VTDEPIQPLSIPVLPSGGIETLELAPEVHSMADTLLYKIRMADSPEQLHWTHGRADGFALGLSVAGTLSSRQSDHLMACYTAARDQCEMRLDAHTQAHHDSSEATLFSIKVSR
jgi:hypothetical protein